MKSNVEYFIYRIPNSYENGIMSFEVYDKANKSNDSTIITVPLFAVRNGNAYYDVFTNEFVMAENIITPTTKDAVKVACLNFVENNYSMCTSVYSSNIIRANEKANQYTVVR